MECGAVPSCSIKLIPVAAVIPLRDHRVSCPPFPLQEAIIAAQVGWNNVTEFVYLHPAPFRWQVEALWVQGVNRLAIRSGIVRNAVRRRLCTYQRPIVDRHLKVTIVVGCDLMLELDHLTTGVCRLDGFLSCTTPSVHTSVLPSASGWHFQEAMPVRT